MSLSTELVPVPTRARFLAEYEAGAWARRLHEVYTAALGVPTAA